MTIRKGLLLALASVSFLVVNAHVGSGKMSKLASFDGVKPKPCAMKVAPMKVSERPEGQTTLWTKYSLVYQVYLEDYALDIECNGSVVEMVEDAEGNVWLNNPYRYNVV